MNFCHKDTKTLRIIKLRQLRILNSIGFLITSFLNVISYNILFYLDFVSLCLGGE